jgi:hypothetical protein
MSELRVTDSPAVGATRAPAVFDVDALPGVRFQMVTLWSLERKARASAVPIRPNPNTETEEGLAVDSLDSIVATSDGALVDNKGY